MRPPAPTGMESPARSSSSHAVRRPDRTQRGGLASSTSQAAVAIASAERGTARVGLLPDRPRRRRWRSACRDLRGPRCRCTRLEPRGPAAPRPRAQPRRHCPSPQRPPTRRRRVLPGAHSLPDRERRPAGQGPQRQRHADCRASVVPARLDAARDHGDDRPAARAAVAPAADHRFPRRVADRQRASHLPLAHSVAVQADPAADRPTRGVAAGAPPGPGLLDRWRSLQPVLDVERAVDDEGDVLGRGHTRRDRGHDAVGVAPPSASPTFGGRRAQPCERGPHRPRPAGPGPTSYAMASTRPSITQPARSCRCSRGRARSLTRGVPAVRARLSQAQERGCSARPQREPRCVRARARGPLQSAASRIGRRRCEIVVLDCSLCRGA